MTLGMIHGGFGRTRAKMVRFLNFLRKLRNRLFGVEELKSELAAERKARVRATNLLHRAILENRRAIGAQHFGSPEADGDPNGLATAEKRIYSQFGEDGIIDHLIRHLQHECQFPWLYAFFIRHD